MAGHGCSTCWPSTRRSPPGAAFADAKLGLGHLTGWERIAVVSDADWLENSIKAFGWMFPGEVRVFDDEVDEATEWLARTDD